MPVTAPSSASTTSGSPRAVSAGTVRLTAIVAGVLGILLCAITPLLPVTATDASFDWPQAQSSGDTSSVVAPLIAQSPQRLDARISCAALAELPRESGSTLVFGTMAPNAPKVRSSALLVTSSAETVTVSFRNSVAATADRAELARCRELRVWSEPAGPGAQFVGLGPATTLTPDKRPQVDGIYSALTPQQARAAADAGMRVHVVIDNRYQSSPTVLKLIVMVLAVLAVVVALVALHWSDRLDQPGHARSARSGLGRWLRSLRPRLTDLTVTGVLLVWTLLGAGSPDDGYILNMGRTADGFGYLANYYRFYGIPEAPFDWYYAFLGHWAAVSPSILWMHIPPLVAGLVSWFVLSRVLLPRLGTKIGGASNSWAVWAAAATFTAFWLPFCSGLRSEGIIVLGSLLTWWAAEHALSTRRLLPAALAAICAGFTLALAPHGVIGIATLIVAARPLLHLMLDRRRRSDRPVATTLALAAPIAAAGLLVLIVVFRDQTLATVIESMKIRYSVGPVISWHQEYLRYYFVSVVTDDGALTRRVPLLLLLASLIVTVAVMLRRGRIPGVNPGPTWRLVGAMGVTLLFFAFTPTKWTIQFGVFAGLGAAMAAIATVAVAQSAARSARNLSVFVAGLLFAMAAAMAGYNAWPFAYEYGISWFDRAPVLAGVKVSNIFLILAVVAAAVAVWQHLRLDYVANKGLSHVDDGPGESRADRRRLFLASSPIAVVATLLVVVELLLFAKAAVSRHPAPTVLSENLNTLRGNGCGLADEVLVESDPNAGMLTPTGRMSATAALSGERPVGFTPDGVPDDLSPEPGSQRPGQMNVSASMARPFAITGGLGAGTTGGRGPKTVNGSTVALPYGLDPARTPVLGSYGHPGEARLTTGWYSLPTDRAATPLLVFSTAGAVSTVDTFGVRNFGQKLMVQFGRPGTDGAFEQAGPDVLPIDPGPVITNRPWRNMRVPMSAAPPRATVMRLVLVDNNLGADQFIGITPPRAPRLRTLQEVVGTADPTLIDFSVGSHFPCQQPMRVRHGVAEVPRWRILPDYPTTNSQSKTWQAGVDGGLLGISEATTWARAVPTYLKDDWARDWGALERLTPFVTAPTADVRTTEQTRWGFSRVGSIRVEPQSDE